MKNLEDEYKRFHQEETPDLWNRIEAGLTDKKAKPKKNIFTFKYASVCAAVVLLVVLLPGIYFLGRNSRNAADMAPQNMAADTVDGDGDGKDAAGGGDRNSAPASGFESEAESSASDGIADSAESTDSAEGCEVGAANIPMETQKEQPSGEMEVADTEQQDGCTVYYLRTKDGQIVSAIPAEGLNTRLQIGKTYLFTLRASEKEAWEYVIEAAE